MAKDIPGSLSNLYPVERELGGGGMSRVFLARDEELGRRIVVKVLHPDLAAAVSLERFRREIRVAAQLTHPHIVPLLNAGEVDGLPYYPMPFIEGESVRARLDRDGRLAIGDALRVATEVANALAYAHKQGIVHRDIKPDNILMQDGHAVVMDFGIARALTQSTTGATLTRVGMTVGTPRYMSPEQVAGEQDLDGRSDVYSLGCVLYEMLTGKPPYEGDGPRSLFAQHLSAPIPKARALRGDVPSALDEVIELALAKEPAKRGPSAGQLAAAVQKAATSAGRSQAASASIAVLPFANLDTADSDYLSDGITEEILNALTRLAGVKVAARASVFTFKGGQHDVREVAAKLNVRHVLQGSVRKAGGRIRISAQLADAESGFQVWSDKYDRELSDVFAIQDEIADIISRRLEAQFRSGSRSRRTDNVEAYDAYLRARFHLSQGTPDGWRKSVEHFDRVIALDPAYADAHRGIAEAMSYLAFIETSNENMARAKSSIARAIALEPDNADAVAVSGFCRCWFDWDFDTAVAEMRRAVDLNPGSATAHYNLTIVLANLGDSEGAVEHGMRAVELDPLWSSAHQALQWALMTAGRSRDALDRARLALDLAPGSINALFPLAWAYSDLGEQARAIEVAGEIVRQAPTSPMGLGVIAVANIRAGRREEAMRGIANMENAPMTPVTCAHLAWAYGALGQLDKAMEWVNRGIETKDLFMGCMPVFGWWDPLREDPRFLEALKRARFPSWCLKRTHEFLGRASATVPEAKRAKPAIAVLRFDNMSADPENEYFAEGIAEDLNVQLARVPALKVISRTSATRYKAGDRSLRDIAQELGVGAVVTGSVRRAGARVRVAAQLIDADSGAQRWAETYDRRVEDVFAVQSDVAMNIARALEATLSAADRTRLERPPTQDARAYELMLLGRHHWVRRNDASIRKAVECFEQAIARDPNYAQAWAGLADTWIFAALGYATDAQPAAAFRKAEEASAKALSLDESLAEAHCAKGQCALHDAWDPARAAQSFERAIAINPNHVPGHQFLAWCRFSLGDYIGATETQKRALTLDPLNAAVVAECSWPFIYAGLPDLAQPFILRSIELDPNFGLAYYNLASTWYQKGEYRKAIEACEVSLRLMGDNPWVLAGLATYCVASGDRERAETVLDRIEKGTREGGTFWLAAALARDALGRVDEAIDALETAFERHEPFAYAIGLEGWLLLSNARATLRFRELMKRNGIVPHDVARQRVLLLEAAAKQQPSDGIVQS